MHLTIWRHGEAGSAVTDRARQLTERGIEDISRAAPRFAALCREREVPIPDEILYSDWVRTRETADILASVVAGASAEPCAALIPGRQPGDVEQALDQRCAHGIPQHVVLVSHQPLVSRLADYLTGEPGLVPGLVPGGFVVLEMAYPGPAAARSVVCAQPPDYEVVL